MTPSPDAPTGQTTHHGSTGVLALGALGVVFGDEIDTASLHRLAWCLAAVSALVLVLDLRAPGGRRSRSSP